MSALRKFLDKNGLDDPRKESAGGKRVATVALRHGDHVLMGKRRDNGKWTSPGGHLEGDEDFHTGALREVKEESGIELHPHQIEPLGEPEHVETPKGKIQVQGFVAHLDERPSTSMKEDPDAEVHRWQWVDVSKGLPDHIAKALHVPIEKNVLRSQLGHNEDAPASAEGEKVKDSKSLDKWMAKNKGRVSNVTKEPDDDDEDLYEGDPSTPGQGKPLNMGKGHGTYKAPTGRMRSGC